MIFLLVTGVALWARGQKILTAIPLPYNLACFWCLFSFVWAIEPGISIRRSIGMYIILQATCIAVQALGTQKTLRVLYLFLAGVLTTSLVSIALSSIPLFSFAVHPANETDASLIGAWRGVLPHKNVAGAMMTHASIVFLHFALNRKKLIDWLFFFGTILFLIGTKSKTSLGLAGIVLAAGVIYRYVVSQRGGNSAFGVLLLCLVLSLGVLGIGANEKIAAYLSDPESFSGRVAIWSSLLTYIKSHIWLGSGYGSFWAIGYDFTHLRYRHDFLHSGDRALPQRLLRDPAFDRCYRSGAGRLLPRGLAARQVSARAPKGRQTFRDVLFNLAVRHSSEHDGKPVLFSRQAELGLRGDLDLPRSQRLDPGPREPRAPGASSSAGSFDRGEKLIGRAHCLAVDSSTIRPTEACLESCPKPNIRSIPNRRATS